MGNNIDCDYDTKDGEHLNLFGAKLSDYVKETLDSVETYLFCDGSAHIGDETALLKRGRIGGVEIYCPQNQV